MKTLPCSHARLVLAWLLSFGLPVLASDIAAIPGTNSSAGLVGELGDPARLVFEGCRAFDANKIKKNLVVSLDFQVAAHPLADREAYLSALQKMVQAGYLHAGFAAAQINAGLEPAAEKVVIHIDEGPRYRSGAIEVTGAKTIPQGGFIRQLTENLSPPGSNLPVTATQPAMSKPITSPFAANMVGRSSPSNPVVRLGLWSRGQPAPFDGGTLRSLTEAVTNTLADLGYFFAQVRVSVVPEPSKETSALRVEIVREGPQGILDQVEITGAKKNSRQDILGFLGLKSGMALNREILLGKEQLLWQSGRFITYKLSPQPPDSSGKMSLEVELRELEEAPPLSEGLSRAEKTFLKFLDWIMGWPAREDDCVLTFGQESPAGTRSGFFQGIFATNGMAMVLREADPQAPQGTRLRYGFISSTNNEGLFSLDRQRKLVSPHLNRHLNAFVHFLPNPNPADPNRFMLEMGAGTDNTNPTFQINFKLAPAGFLSFAHPERGKITFDQDEMIFEGDDIGLRVNCASGRLEDFHFLLTKTTNQFASASLNRLIGKVTFEKGAYERLAREIGEASVNYTNAYDSQTPVSSLVAFVVEELVQVPPVAGLVFGTVPPERLKQASICLETLFIKNRQILAPFERLIEQYQTPEGEESFLIPRDADSQSSGDSMTALWAGILIRLSADALPAGSWPSLLAREAGLAAAGKGQHTAQVLSAIYQSPQSGPLAFWATASLLKRFNIEAFRSFANGGLTRLTAADFRNDYRMLLEGDSALTQCLANLADTLRDLGDTEREGLAIILPPPECELLRRCIRDLRSDKGQPLVSVLAPALDAYWDQTLKGRIRSALLGLALNSKATGTSSSAEAKQPADATPPNALASSLPKDPEAQFQLERRLTQERGAAKNPGEAAKWYRRAAEQGHVLAQVGLGYAYAQGDGVPKDDTEAVKWFLLAAGKGNTDAQFNVATLYYQGQGTPQNYAEAEKWFRCVAEKGDPEAQSIVGVFYVQGWGVATNYAKAEHWLRQSAEQGNPKGQCNLGVLYRLGTGVPQDEVEALVWFTLAANQGHDKARQYRDEIRSKLTAEQIAEAERRAKAFAPRKANR